MGKIRAVIFDFGGVLVRMADDQPRLKLAHHLGVPLSRIDDLVFNSESAKKASLGEISVGMHWEAVRLGLGIQPDDIPAFQEQYWSADYVNWELLEFIRALRPRYKVGMLSNAWDDLRQTLHDRWDIDGLFDELIISAEVKMIKPDPRIFNLAVDRLGVHPAETVFLDDIAENVVAAAREGLHAIQYLDTQQAVDKISGYLSEE